MATPDRVELPCPVCGNHFRARSMGSSYFIAGVDTDLRETGSIEDVRRYCIATCPHCCYSDYTWEFLEEPLAPEVRAKVGAALGTDPEHPGPARNRPFGDFERLSLARTCFEARALDRASLAELALLAYYVAQDLGRRDLEPELREDAYQRFLAAQEDELPEPLAKRYAYLAGELARRGGREDEALQQFARAMEIQDEDGDWDPEGRAWDIGRMAQRMHARVQYQDADPDVLLELIEGEDPDVASEASRLLATRRDRASLDGIARAFGRAGTATRVSMLRELVVEPRPEFAPLFLQALQAQAPEELRLGARGLGGLADPAHAPALLAALERGVLSTEAALTDALRRVGAPGTFEAVAAVLGSWEQQTAEAAGVDESWFFTSDPAPLRTFLYTSGTPRGRELLLRDLAAAPGENDLWDKVPSGGPVSAAIAFDGDLSADLVALLRDDAPAARRWAAYVLAERGVSSARAAIAPLLQDPDAVVRLQAASSLARLGDPSHEQVVLEELGALDKGDLPFALHFLVGFRSPAVKDFLLQLWREERAARSELLPLLGRQALDAELEALLNTSLLENDDDTRAGAVTGLAFTGTADAAARLRVLYDLEDSDEVLRRLVHGLGALARAGHHREETLEFLRERLERATPRLRFPIALTLLQLDDPTGIDVVRERAALFHESYDRYDLAAPALGALARYEAQQRAGS
ncbi:MAG: DUF2225 domain-containing protein [Planctomycetota bacterium]